MKLFTIEEGTPCIVVADIKSNAETKPFITTKELTFDYPFWDARQLNNRGPKYLTERAQVEGHNKTIIRKVAANVEQHSMYAFTSVNKDGATSLMLVDDRYVECM